MAGYGRGFGGGFGGGNQMQQLMKQAQKMQEQMQKAQEELENTEIVGTAGGGAVKVYMSGKKTVYNMAIDPEVVDVDDIEMLEDLIMAAYNDALSEAEELYKEVMSTLEDEYVTYDEFYDICCSARSMRINEIKRYYDMDYIRNDVVTLALCIAAIDDRIDSVEQELIEYFDQY